MLLASSAGIMSPYTPRSPYKGKGPSASEKAGAVLALRSSVRGDLVSHDTGRPGCSSGVQESKTLGSTGSLSISTSPPL